MNAPSPNLKLKRDRDAKFQTRFDRIAAVVENTLLLTILAVMVLVASTQIVLREGFGGGFVWADELLKILVLWIAVVGGMAAARVNRHLSIDALNKLLPPRYEAAAMVFVASATVAVCGLFSYHAALFVADAYRYDELVLGNLPAWPFLSVMPLGVGVIGIYYVRHLVNALWQAVTGRELGL